MKIQEISKSRISIQNQDQNSFSINLRLKIGQEPFYIGPKMNENYMGSQPSMLSQTEQNSQMDIPKFHSPSLNESMIFSNHHPVPTKKEAPHEMIEFNQQKQTKNSTMSFIVQLIIWLLYFIGSMETSSSSITSFHIIDCIGNVISLVFVIYTIYSNKGLNSVSQILHIWSIILTVTVLVYPQTYSQISHSDKTFIKIINIFRSLRLLFPLFNRQIQFEQIKKGFLIVYKLKKIILFGLFWLFLVGIFYYQIFADSQGNRCRASQIPQLSREIIPIDGRLCGRRQCPQNSFCTNPKMIGLQFTEQQKNSKRAQQNLFSFDSSIESMFSIFQIFSLNKWGMISQIYFDIYPSFISVPFYVLGFIGFRFLMLALILIFLEVQKQEKQSNSPLMKNITQNRFSFNSQKLSASDIKISINDNSINPLGSYKTFMLPSNQKEKLQQNQEDKNDNNKIKVTLYCLLILYSTVHYILASQFGLNPLGFNQDLNNRKIGIALVIFFIIHFITLNLIKFEFLNQNEDEENQNVVESSTKTKEKDDNINLKEEITEIVLKFEYFTFFMSLADYLIRLIEGKYLLQETSGLTPFCHFLFGLRFYYVILALVDILDLKLIKGHILLLMRTMMSGLRFIKIFLLIACFLGLISFIISNDDNNNTSKIPARLIYEINQIFMFLANHSWQSLYGFSFNNQAHDQNSLYVKIVGGICLFFGSVIFLTYFVSYLINEAFWNDKQNLQQKSSDGLNSYEDKKNNPQQGGNQEDDQQTKALKQQKSFYIFSYDNILRQSALTIIKDKYYQQTIKFRFYLVYLLVTIISICFCQNQTYRIISLVMEGFILLDILVTALAFRFFGKFSYSQDKILPVTHFLASIIIVAFSITNFQLHIVGFLQFTKFLVVLNYFQSLQQTLNFIQKLHKRFILHFLILIPILLGQTLILFLLLSSQNSNLSFIQKLLESLKISLILFTQKGWNLNLIIGQNNLTTLFGQLSLSAILIIWMVFSLSFFCSLTGMIFSQLAKIKICKEQQQLGNLYGSNILLEELKIKEKIKKIRPKFDYHLYGSGFLLKLCTSKFFLFTKKTCCLCCFICFLILNINLSTEQRVLLYSVHLFFFTIELLVFILESFCYKFNQQYFWRNLVLNILSIPGSYIGFVNPVRYSNQSYELKVILQFFNALSILRFIKVIFYFQVFEKMFQHIYSKLSKTLHILALVLVTSCSLGGYLYLVLKRKQPVLDCFNYAFLGLMGGDFNSAIQFLAKRNQIQLTYQLHLLYLVVNLSTQIFYSLLIAFLIYQVSEVILQQIPLKNTDYNLYNFNKYFHQNEFLNQWMKMDPQGKGFVNFKLILHKSHFFIRHFSVQTLPYKSYQNRIQIFKKLNLQIFEAQTIIQKEDQKDSYIKKEYAINFYDFLYALNKFVFKEIKSQKLIDRGEYFIRNENYNEQPISFLNINSGAFEIMMNGIKKDLNVQHKSQELNEKWHKQNYSLVKEILKERLEEHPQIEGMNSVLKSTNLKSQDLYYAYRVKNKLLRFLKDIKICSLTKGNYQGFKLKQKK